MQIVGIALFLFAGSFLTPNTRQGTFITASMPASLAPGSEAEPAIPQVPPDIAPDPAPPHPLKPRFVPEGPLTGLARAVAVLANSVLRYHGR